MELHLVITVLCHLILSLIADAKNLAGHVHLGDHGLNSSVPFNVTINGTLVPPYHRNTNGTLLPGYHRNITAGAAWVVPASPFDLGARSMTCECFDPDETCCMPSSNDIAPFCLPQGATCCDDTLCEAGEICCRDYCCDEGMTCSSNPNVPGCCPNGQICNDQPATCLDGTSSECSDVFFSSQQCCPSYIPYCRSFGDQGYGCFGTPENSSTDSTTSTSAGSVPAPASSSDATNGNGHSGTTILVETLSVKYLSSGALSLQFPETMTLAPNLAGWSISTSYVFSFPSTIFDENTSSTSKTVSTSLSKTSSKVSHTTTTTTTTTSSSKSSSLPSTTTKTTTSTSSKSHTSTSGKPLCWDPMVQTPLHCSPASPTASTSGSYPVATTLHSSSSSARWNRIYSYSITSYVILIWCFFHYGGLGKAIVAILWYVNVFVVMVLGYPESVEALDEMEAGFRQEKDKDKDKDGGK